MFEEVKEKLLQYSEYPQDQLSEKTEIINDLRIDSLNIMVIIGDYEEEYNVRFEVEDIKDIVTVGDFVKVLENKINNK